ncbi:MAG TPA: hypothetical protein VIF09_08275 [Polyangiaceae bacterium]
MRSLLVLFAVTALAACSSAPGEAVAWDAAPVDSGSTPAEAGGPSGGDAGPVGLDAATDTGVKGPLPEAGLDAAIPEAGADSAPLGGTWAPVSFGVTTRDTGGGANIAIAYGGYTATDADSQAWVMQLTTVRLAQLGVGHLYAVRGPKDADYASREIGNSELATALATQATPATRIVIVAHSSGGFVADELFTFAGAGVLAKTTYFDLDGGSWSLTDALVGSMRGVYFCNAHDAVAGDSENTSSDQSLHAQFAASHYFTVDADGSGCNVGAGWCLHDTLITNHPHDPATFDLALDYTDFTGTRQVVASYIDQALSDGAL